MDYGNKPSDGGFLIISADERDDIISTHAEAERYIRPYMGSQEVVNNYTRYCIWSKKTNLQKQVQSRNSLSAFKW